MIYLDTSVALAHLLGEDRRPPDRIWDEPLIASRLLQYELWSRIHAYGLTDSHGDATRSLLARVAMLALDVETLARALEAFPTPVRTLDGLHLASLYALRERGLNARLATYDDDMRKGAKGLKLPIYALDE